MNVWMLQAFQAEYLNRTSSSNAITVILRKGSITQENVSLIHPVNDQDFSSLP